MSLKNFLISILLLCSFSTYAQVNFSVVTYGTGVYQPQEIFFGDSEEVYSVGQCTVRGTTNGEIYWTGYCYTILNLLGGDIPARANCFVVGAHGVIRKNEACEIFGSWRDQTSGTTDSLFSVKFFNVDTGFVVGQNGKVLRTYNNGRNWTIIPNTITETLRRIIFTPDKTLYAVGDNGVIIKSTDLGNNWISLTSGTTEIIKDIDFISNDTGFVVGSGGVLLKTTDAGATWNPLTSGVTSKLNGVEFITSDKGFIVGDNGVVRRTTDGGLTWTPFLFSSFNNNVADIKFRDANNGYFAAQQDFYKTIDGGLTWYDMSQELQSVEFPSKETGYAVGKNVMRKTIDGGLSWTNTHPYNGATMYDAFFLNTDTGFASGTRGSMYKTVDGGNSWVSQNTHCTSLLRSVHFFNANNGIAVGTNYTITRTTNGGTTWVTDSAPNPSFYGYHDIFFATPSKGWICGSQGKIYKTTNGGATFTAQTSGVTYYLLKIFFLDTLKGFAIGEHGTVLKTLDGGANWATMNLAVTSFFNAIAFYDSLNGYIAGESGIFFETNNGGATWIYRSLNTGNIYDITFYDGYHGYLVGAGDYRARYEPIKSLNDYSETCGSGGYYISPLIAKNIQIDTGNVFIMEMDTTGNDFNDSFILSAAPRDSGNFMFPFTLSPDFPAGRYQVRLRGTRMHPVSSGVPTTLKVFGSPVAHIAVSNDTLSTPYHPEYIYQWRNGFTGIPGATSNYLVVTQPGDYSVIVTHGCCSDATDNLRIDTCGGALITAPVVRSNATYIVCDSATVRLTASGAPQYRWYESDTGSTVLSTDSFYVTPPITNTDTFYVSAFYGSCESSRVKIMIYKTGKPATPTVSNVSQCENTELFIFPQGSTSFNWYHDSLSAAFLTNQSFYHIANPVNDTLYIATLNYDCPSYFVPVIVSIDQAPTTGNITGASNVFASDVISYHYTSLPGSTLHWAVTGGSFVVYQDSIVVSWGAAGGGLIQVLETSATGCAGDTVSLSVNINTTTSIVDKTNDQIFIFPNPVTNQLTIKLNDLTGTNMKAKIYNVLGNLVSGINLLNPITNISTTHLAAGIYYLEISDNENIMSSRLIIKSEP